MPITGQDSTKIAEYSDNAVYTAPLGTAIPAGPFPTAFGSGWSILGHLASDGITAGRDSQNQREFSSTGDLVYESWSQLDESYTCICDESNPVVENLKNPNAVQTVATAGTAEVQTLTVTGTPTAGNYVLSFRGGTATVAYNATSSAIQTAVRTLPGLGTATVSGTSPTFTVNYPAALGNVELIGIDNSGMTGGTVAAAETTAGAAPVFKWVKTSSGILTPQLRLFAVDAVKLGTPGWAERAVFTGKATATDIGVIGKGNIRKTTFQISKYVDSVLGVETVLSTNPAHAANVFA